MLRTPASTAREIALQRVRALDPEQRADLFSALCALRQQGLEIRARAHQDQCTARAGDGFLEAIGLQLRASQRAAPGERRELRHSEQRQQIEGVAFVALDVEAEGNDGGGCEEL